MDEILRCYHSNETTLVKLFTQYFIRLGIIYTKRKLDFRRIFTLARVSCESVN